MLETFGITRVADLTGLDEVGIPVFQAVRPASHTLSVSQGKGVSLELARVSAVMEAIELWHAERVIQRPVRGSARDLGPLGYDVADLNLVPGSLISDTVVLHWLAGRGILTGKSVWVPYDCVALSALVTPGWTFPGFAASSSGLASGNSLAEATLHGLYELIERACSAAFNKLAVHHRVRLDLASIDDPDCRWLLDRLKAADNGVEAFETTSAVGVPAFEAHITSPVVRGVCSGGGCHLDAGVALSRALSEAAQSRLTLIAGTRDDIEDDSYELPATVATDRTARSKVEGVTPFRRRPPGPTDSIDEDLTIVASLVMEHTGVEPLVVDLTRPSHHVPVVKVVAPGLHVTGRRQGSAV